MNPTIRNIANLFYNADKQCRKALIKRTIVDEREYMARLITYLDSPWGYMARWKRGYTSYFMGRTLDHHHETKLGCDAMFSFRYRNQIKILCIESKRLDFRGPDDWDNIDMNKPNPASRFTKQIRKQQILVNNGALVYEMFLNDEQQNSTRPGYDKLVSSLVKRDIALTHQATHIDPTPRKWKWTDADTIVQRQSGLNPVDIRYLIIKILECEIGNRLDLGLVKGDSQFVFNNDNNEFNLPIPDLNTILDNKSIIEKIRDFIEQSGIGHIGFFQSENEDFFGLT